MNDAMALRAGTPLEDDRDYLPEALRGSDLVVNENGNNSQPYPEGLREHRGELVPGQQNTWYSYIPHTLRADQAAPLVISLHGGLMTGWGQAVYSSWTLIAEREGLIVVFPDASSRRLWTLEVVDEHIETATTPNPSGIWLDPPADRIEDFADVRLLRALIDWARAEHHVDLSRTYFHGMSMGHVMSDQFVRHYGHRVAAAAGSGGLSALGLLFDADGEPVNSGGPVPMLLTLAEHDTAPPFTGGDVREVARGNRRYWQAVNGVTGTPRISVRGRENYAFYQGEHADLIFRDVQGRDHGQTFDDAEITWSHLFSSSRRNPAGGLEHSPPLLAHDGDAHALALADGADRAWVDQRTVPVSGTPFRSRSLKYHGLGGDEVVRDEHLLAPVAFIAEVFNARLMTNSGDTTAQLQLADGRQLDFARGSVGCLIDGHLRAMDAAAVWRDGQLFLPIEWLAVEVWGLQSSTCGRVLYLTDHHARLSTHLAHIIEDLLDEGAVA